MYSFRGETLIPVNDVYRVISTHRALRDMVLVTERVVRGEGAFAHARFCARTGEPELFAHAHFRGQEA